MNDEQREVIQTAIDRSKLIEVFTEAWEAKRREIGRGIAPKGTKTGAGIDAVLAALAAQPVTGAVEWGTAVADDPEIVVAAPSEDRARASVDGWNSSHRTMRGELPKGLLMRRTVTDWEEVN
jgi:hypothetical protein